MIFIYILFYYLYSYFFLGPYISILLGQCACGIATVDTGSLTVAPLLHRQLMGELSCNCLLAYYLNNHKLNVVWIGNLQLGNYIICSLKAEVK
jgi:hypothetical protein